MKLLEYAKKNNILYRAAWNRFKKGLIPGAFKNEFGTIIVPDLDLRPDYVVVYARVSSSENKKNLDYQAERVSSFCLAKGWVVKEVVKECASGLNDSRPKLLRLFKNEQVTKVVVEHKDRITRFGFNYLTSLWNVQIIVINEVVEDEKDLMQDFVSLVTSFCARIYGKRRTKRKTEQLIKELQND